MRQGALGLAQRLSQFNDILNDPDDDLGDADLDDDADVSLDTSTGSLDPRKQGNVSLKLLMKCEKKLVKMLEIMGRTGSRGGEEEEATKEAKADKSEAGGVWSPRDNDDPVLHENNIRVATNARKDSMPTPRSVMSEDDRSVDDHGGERREGVEKVMKRQDIKKEAQKKASDALKKKEQQAKREARKNKIDRNREKKMVMERLVNSHPEPVGLTFLTQKPDMY